MSKGETLGLVSALNLSEECILNRTFISLTSSLEKHQCYVKDPDAGCKRKPQEISDFSLAVDYAVTNQGQQLQLQ